MSPGIGHALNTLGLAPLSRLPRLYWLVWFGLFFSRLGRFVVPFLSIHLTNVGVSPVRIGWIVSALGVGTLLSAPIGGWLADTWGRRSTILLGMVGGAASMVAFPASPLWGLEIAAFLMGLSTDLPRPAISAVVSDVVPEEDRTTAFAALYWAMNLAFSVAPVLGGILASHDSQRLFWCDAIATAAFAGMILWGLPETRPVGVPQRETPTTGGGPYTNARAMLFVGLSVAVHVVFMQHVTTLPLAITGAGISPATYGIIMAINGVVVVLMQPLSLRALNRWPQELLFMVGATVLGLGFAAQAWAHVPWHFALCVVVWSMGEVLFAPTASAFMARLAPLGQAGRYQGAYQMSWGIAFIVSPAVGMPVLAHYGPFTLWLGSGALVGVGVVLYALGRLWIRPAAGAQHPSSAKTTRAA